jgi:hypothetical protein
VNDIPGALQEYVSELRQVYPAATISSLLEGTSLVTVASVPLPHGWSAPTTDVSFVVPTGFPMARPDCFWASAGLRLASGAMPRNSGVNAAPGSAEPRLWFSWHAAVWNPSSDTLLTYVRIIQRRFAEAC